MVLIRINLPKDLSFLSSIFYEGLLFCMYTTPYKVINTNKVELESTFLQDSFKRLSQEKIASFKMPMSGNDNINKLLLKAFNINDQSKKTYADLLEKLTQYSDNLQVAKPCIALSIDIKGKDMVIDITRKQDGLSAPQIFKVDRYTGISSLDTNYTTQQLTLYASKEAILIGLLGLYSSFVASCRQQRQSCYYFLTFAPESISLIGLANPNILNSLILAKNEIAEELSKILQKTTINELILLETYINSKIISAIEKTRLESLSLVLFKISPEGQTYKIYEQIPLTIYRKETSYVFKFLKNLCGDDVDSFVDFLARQISADGVLFQAITTLTQKNKYDEADNALQAIHELYRFIVLNDLRGIYGFTREIFNCYKKLEGKGRKSKSDEYRERCYLEILNNIKRFI